MLISVTDENGVTYEAKGNIIFDIPVGTHIVSTYVDGGVESCDLIADGEPLVVSLKAIRRIRATPKAA